MPPIITVHNLSKRYVIGHQRASGDGLRHRIEDAFRAPWNWLRSRNSERRKAREDFWALRDVTFEIPRGEAVGIIGRNGAGKSTLLKILSRITEPTTGRITLRGRVASLLEVGTGFHQELTGRENIFLNGAILGMAKSEIKRKFDEIVAFSEVEKFLDTPVKRYSSGMYVRLAFAVAAHLEPEILIVDEVLAVGDAQFQKKCLGKMGEVTAEGERTVLFVSHNMSAISALCSKALLLQGGHMAAYGPTPGVIAQYQTLGMQPKGNDGKLTGARRRGSGKLRFTSFQISCSDPSGAPAPIPFPGCTLEFSTTVVCSEAAPEANVALIIYDANSYRLVDVNTALKGLFVQMASGDTKTVRFTLKNLLLRPGTYSLELWAGRGGIEEFDNVEDVALLTVVEPPGKSAHTETFPGPYQCEFDVTVEPGLGGQRKGRRDAVAA